MTVCATVEGHRQRKLEYDRNRKSKEGYRERDAARKRREYWKAKQKIETKIGVEK